MPLSSLMRETGINSFAAMITVFLVFPGNSWLKVVTFNQNVEANRSQDCGIVKFMVIPTSQPPGGVPILLSEESSSPVLKIPVLSKNNFFGASYFMAPMIIISIDDGGRIQNRKHAQECLATRIIERDRQIIVGAS
jgi:hypothetical protein